MKTLLVLLLLSSSYCFGQTPKQRLIAQSGYSANVNIPNSWYLQDSAVLVYSGGRGSMFNYSSMQYFNLADNVLNALYGMVTPNNIDAIDNSLHVQFDSLLYFNRDNTNRELSLYERYAIRYFSDGRYAESYHITRAGGKYHTSTTHRKFIYFYDQLIRELPFRVMAGNGLSDTSVYRTRFFLYDAAGNCVIDSSELPMVFGYDVPGQYSTRNYSTWNLFEYTYYPDGRVKSILYSEPDSGVTGTKILDSFGYTPGVPGYTHRTTSWIDYPNRVNPFRIVSFHINALGQKDSILITNPSYGHFERAYFVYNHQGNPEYKVYEAGYGTTVSHRTKTVYYYENYQPSLSAGGAGSHNTTPLIYPNPASTRLFAAAVDVKEVHILDLAGKLILAAPCTSSGIDISTLRDGMYIVRLMGTDETLTTKMWKR